MPEDELALTPEYLASLSPEELLLALDTGWPWPLDAVQQWFESLWNFILEYFYKVVNWIYDRLKPLFDAIWGWITTEVGKVWGWITTEVGKVWGWIQSEVSWLWSNIQAIFSQVWSWLSTGFSSIIATLVTYFDHLTSDLGSFAASIGQKVTEINQWFSNEFIDPFIDWLVQFPGKLAEAFKNFFVDQWNLIWGFWSRDWNWLKLLTGMVLAFIGGAIVIYAPAIGIALVMAIKWAGGALLRFAPLIGGWFLQVFSRFGGWLITLGPVFSGFLLKLLGGIGKWLARSWVPLISAGAIIGLEATGQLEELVRKLVTPAILGVFDWFEKQGPVAPSSGQDMSRGITKLAEFTISGLAAMTLGGELLSPLKHLGLGHISAIIYDLINYKTLTAAFMGVLAFVYIKTPLTYYYQKMARPNIPDERSLLRLAGEYAISKDEFKTNMQWQGYPDEWIAKLYELADRPLTPFLFRYLGEAGILDEELLDRELHNAGYNEKTIPYLKTWLHQVSTGELKTLMVGTTMKRFREGFDDAATLQKNLEVLGVSPALMSKYLFAAQLDYLTDYQGDLITYYKDAYRRREMEEPEFRSSLIVAGLALERVDLEVQRERIKRLKAPQPTEPDVSTVRIDTIRRKRRKLLITREEEIEELTAIGVRRDDAIAFVDNDEVRLAGKAEIE